MKTNKPYILLLLLALTAVFTCCSGDDYSDINTSGSPASGSSTAPFTITVTDGGYASHSGGSSTRASEANYKTIFTEGDQIGVFAVKGSKIVNEVNNLCLTATNASDLTWKDAKGNPLADVKGATYYAYYPYQKDLKGKFTSVSQSCTAEEFFANVISNWFPKSDQSTHAKYTAQDLMIAKGTMTPNVKSLSFSMKHQMALAVIDLPRIEYTFLNNNPSIPNYITDVLYANFGEYKPCRMEDGTYRYLLKPSTQDALLSGSYTSAKGSTAWEVNTKNIATGKYQIFEVDGGSSVPIKRTHELKIGDFFMKDGSLIAGAESLIPEQQAACIGIVMKVGRDNSGDWIDTGSYITKGGESMTTVHGYVLALYDAKEGAWCPSRHWFGVNWTGFQGYMNTKRIIALNEGSLKTNLPAFYCATEDYETNHPAPINSSGWFLPSNKQCSYWYNNRVILLSQVRIAMGNISYNWKGNYWSSTEIHEGAAWNLPSDTGRLFYGPKHNNSGVRSFLAF